MVNKENDSKAMNFKDSAMMLEEKMTSIDDTSEAEFQLGKLYFMILHLKNKLANKIH